MQFKNFMEDVVVEVYQDFIARNSRFCNCDRCKLDTMTLALTRLQGKYAATKEGEVLARVSRDDRQVRTNVLVALMEAAEIVSKNPKH
jgi:competence protein ComFB